MSTLYLVRHAAAGDRSRFEGPDRLRPLSPKGLRQADGLRDQLAGCGATRLFASPYRRCVQTLEPLAAKLGATVEEADALAEGADALDALALAEELRATPIVFCSHGDVIPDMLEEAVRRGMSLQDELRWQKASTWVLTWEGDRLATGRYLRPPRT